MNKKIGILLLAAVFVLIGCNQKKSGENLDSSIEKRN